MISCKLVAIQGAFVDLDADETQNVNWTVYVQDADTYVSGYCEVSSPEHITEDIEACLADAGYALSDL